MLKYLSILLDDSSPSYCHYENWSDKKLISLTDLQDGILFAMKNNLSVQFVYPDLLLPQEYIDLINTIDHINISSFDNNNTITDVVIIDRWHSSMVLKESCVCIFRLTKTELFNNAKDIINLFSKVDRLNVVVKDVESFVEDDFNQYNEVLKLFVDKLCKLYANGRYVQTNIITDRILLNQMNNCNAGVENITLAPDGKFYICPAFYYAGECDGTENYQNDVCKKGYSIGSLVEGVNIKLPQLYQLDHAPLCRHCDAYQCKRCIWLNRKTTLEVNTPSHEQCVMAHLERNASRKFLSVIQEYLPELSNVSIPEIDYLDPFDIRNSWKN